MEHPDPDLEASTERLLVIELSKGNETVLKKLFDTYSHGIYAYALSLLKSEAHAEEIVRDVFLAVWTGRKKLDTSLSFKSQLFTMARDKVFNFLKKAANDTKLREEVFYRSQKSYKPKPGDIGQADMQQAKQQLIDLLPPRRKLIFEMSYNDGKSYYDISQELGISTSTVRSQICRARETIRSFLSGSGEIVGHESK